MSKKKSSSDSHISSMKEDNTVGLYSDHFGVYFFQNVVVFSEF